MHYPSLLLHKLKAVLLHAMISIAVALCCALLVFYVWYPNGLARVLDSAQLFLLIVSAELVLGPLMSFVIYDPRKVKGELVRDYAIIGGIQAAALAYGMHTSYIARPVYEVFVIDRVEVITALELKEEDLKQAAQGYQQLQGIGVRQVCVNRPQTVEEKNEVLFTSLSGKDLELMPKYYRACGPREKLKAALPKSRLVEALRRAGQLERVQERIPEGDFSWLPLKTRFGAWVEAYPSANGEGESLYLDIDPFSIAIK